MKLFLCFLWGLISFFIGFRIINEGRFSLKNLLIVISGSIAISFIYDIIIK